MIHIKVKNLSEIEKKILAYNAKEGISTSGKYVSIYINAIKRFHPDDIKQAINELVEKGYYTSNDNNNSIYLTSDGIYECRKSFKYLILCEKYKKNVIEIVKYSLKNLIVPIVVTILTTLLLHFIFGNPLQQTKDTNNGTKYISKDETKE